MRKVFDQELKSDAVQEILGHWYYLKKGNPMYEPLAPIIVLIPEFHIVQQYRDRGWIVEPVIVFEQSTE